MKTEPLGPGGGGGGGGDSSKPVAPKKPRFIPKIPPRKVQKVPPKSEPVEIKDDIINKDLLSKLHIAKNEGLDRRGLKIEKKAVTRQGAFAYGDVSSFSRPIVKKGPINGSSNLYDAPSSSNFEKEYVEPWNYDQSYYPITLPLRRPYTGDPEILNQTEFGNASMASSDGDASTRKHAEKLGLAGWEEEPQMMFIQLPASLPLETPYGDDNKKPTSSRRTTGGGLKDLPAGFMGKLLVYKSGAVKLKIGNAIFEVSPGTECVFAQDVAALNVEEKHCCVLGEVAKRAVVTPDVDSMLNSIDINNVDGQR